MNEANATPHAELIAELMNPNIPKNEREHAAAREIERLRETRQAVIAGALFDFMGWLTSRPKRIMLSSADEASPAVDAIKEFAKMRGLSLDDARVQDWQDNTTPPAQPAPVQEPDWKAEYLKSVESGCITLDELREARVELEAIKQTLAAPVQEPDHNDELTIAYMSGLHRGKELAPQRQWVGLTNQERSECWETIPELAMKKVEAKLKERNT